MSEAGFGQQWRLGPALLIVGALLLLSPPLAIASVIVGLAEPRWARRPAVLVGTVAVAVVLAISGALGATLIEGWSRLITVNGFDHHPDVIEAIGRKFLAARPPLVKGWLLLVFLAPVTGWVLGAVRPRRAQRESEHRALREQEREARRRRRAERAAGRALTNGSGPGDAIWLGQRLAGEDALPCRRGRVSLDHGRLLHHLLVMGATGSGKTESLLRIVGELVRIAPESPIFYLDGKGDREAAERFLGLMEAAGRRTRLFPDQPYCGWRGAGQDLYNRLIEVIDYTSEGPAAYYRDIAKAVLSLACEHPDGPPTSSRTLLRRLDLAELRRAHGGVLAGLSEEQVRQVRLRYEAFFRQVGSALDGLWAWEDADAAYLLLDSLALKEDAHSLARFLFEDFGHYFTRRKPRERFCTLIVDEFSALARSGSMASRIEQARGFGAALILAPQVAAGMGDEEETERILGSVETILLHRVNTPERIIELAGTRQSVEWSQHHRYGLTTGEGVSRLQHQFKVDPNEVRSLEPGQAFAIARGRAMKLLVARAPNQRIALPQRPARATPDRKPAAVREVPY